MSYDFETGCYELDVEPDYDAINHQKIVDGENNDYLRHIEEIIERIENESTDIS